MSRTQPQTYHHAAWLVKAGGRLTPVDGTTIYMDRLPRNVGGIVGGKPHSAGSDLTRLTEPAHRECVEDALEHRRIAHPLSRIRHQPQCYRVERNAALGHLDRNAAQQSLDTRFGRAVNRYVRHTARACPRGDLANAAPSAPGHPRQHRPDAIHRTVQVQIDIEVPLCRIRIDERAGHADALRNAGIVDQDIDRAKRLLDASYAGA